MGTFHHFARILRSEAHKLSNFTIYDTQDSVVRLISQITKEMQLDRDVYKPKK
jgi:DNA helicase-2/ATP-dependent DNA helicase PcrA